jgi:hypothetical protein
VVHRDEHDERRVVLALPVDVEREIERLPAPAESRVFFAGSWTKLA